MEWVSVKRKRQLTKMEKMITWNLVDNTAAIRSDEVEIEGFKWVLSREQAPAKDPVPIFTLFCNRNSSQPADRLFACRAKCTFETVERQDDQQGSPAAEPDDNEWTKWTDQRGTEPSYFFTSNNSRHLVLHKGIKLAAIRVLIQVVWTAHETCFPAPDAVLSVKYGQQQQPKMFHVNRLTLASRSPAFAEIFFDSTKRKRPPNSVDGGGFPVFDIEEQEADYSLLEKAFGRMLNFVHILKPLLDQQRADVFEESVPTSELLDILELAVKYTVPMLVHYGRRSLRKRDAMEQLVVADAQNRGQNALFSGWPAIGVWPANGANTEMPANASESKGTISWELPSPMPEDEVVMSDEVEIGDGFKWMVYGRMVRDDPPPYFRFTLSCNRNCPDHRLFACKVKYAFGAKSAEGEDDWVKWSNTEPAAAVHFFASNNLRECGLDFVYTTMSVGIEIVWSAHGTCFPAPDAILNVKYGNKGQLSKAFPVNRFTLASHSPTFFDNFFFADWAERRNNQLHAGDNGELEMFDIEESDNVDLKAFARMLYFLHLSVPLLKQQPDIFEQISSAEILNIVVLAVKYTIPMLEHYGQQVLTKRGTVMEQLVMADVHNLPALKKHCLKTLDMREYCKNLEESTEMRAKLGKETRRLLDKRIKETTKQCDEFIYIN